MSMLQTILVLAGYGFAALAGIGGGLILDHVNTDKRRRIIGWVLLICSLPLSGISLVVGLP